MPFNTTGRGAIQEIYGRHDRISRRVSVGAGLTVKLLEGNVARHTLRVRNLSTTTDVNYGTTEAEATSADKAQTLMARQTDIFELHVLGFHMRPDGDLEAQTHSEWDDDMYVNNPGAGAVTIEVLEII